MCTTRPGLLRTAVIVGHLLTCHIFAAFVYFNRENFNRRFTYIAVYLVTIKSYMQYNRKREKREKKEREKRNSQTELFLLGIVYF